MSQVSISGRVTGFSLLHNVQTRSGGLSASYTMGKAAGGVKLITHLHLAPRLSIAQLYCGLVVRVPGYSSRGPGFDSWRYQIFGEVVGLKRGPLSLVRIIEELRKK
jgi:hypothetical protein